MNVINKQSPMSDHALHRVVAGAAQGRAWVDRGTQVILPDADRMFALDEILAGTMRACVSRKVKGRHRYFHTGDWRSRHEWLERKGQQHGFEVISAHCTATQKRIEKPGGAITVDQTDFVFVIKVLDPQRFRNAYLNGVSSTAKTYGYNFINV